MVEIISIVTNCKVFISFLVGKGVEKCKKKNGKPRNLSMVYIIMVYIISTYFHSILQSNNYCTHQYIVLLICHTVPHQHNVLDMVHTADLIYTARQDTLQ